MPKTFRENLEDINAELESLTEKATEIASAVGQQTSAIIAASDAITFAIADASREITSAVREQTALLDIRLSETNWQLSLQTQALFSIDHTLKTPTETLANEWRARAEELRRRGELKQAEHLFLRCLEPENNPLDYRTYIGLAKTYELLGEPEKALEYYEKSLKHAPKFGSRDWRSYSYMLMSLVYKALSEHREAFESTRKAVRFSPKYPAAHYHHARNAALVGEQASCAFSLIEAVRASAHFCVSAMLDSHFDQWRSDVAELIVRTTLSTPQPDSQYHRTWFKLSKHCASLGQVENSINLLEKVISFDPSYYSKAQDAISSFAPLESAIKSFLERLHSNAKTKAKQSIKDAESKLPTVKEFIAEAKLAMEMARDKEQLNSEAAYESAQSSLDLARKKLESENFEELMKIPPIAQEVKISIDSALKTAREEKVFYERRKSQKKSKAWDQLWDELWITLLFLPVGGMVGSFLFSVFVYPISPEWVDSHSRSFPISGLIAGLAGAILYKIGEAREIMGYDNSNFKSLSYTFVFTLYFLLLFLLKV